MQNAKFKIILPKSKVIALFLCDARQQIRSIVGLCEEFGDRRTRAKRINQNDFFYNLPPIKDAMVLGMSVWSRQSRNFFSPTPLVKIGVYIPVW